MKSNIISAICLILLNISTSASATASTAIKSLTVLTTRPQTLIMPVLKLYEAKYDVKIRLISINQDHLQQELDTYKQADLLIADSSQTLSQANQAGGLMTSASEMLAKQVPDHLKSKDMSWFGLTRKAKLIAYNSDNVSDRDLFNYDGLASQMWKGRLCLTTAQHPDTVEFVSDLLVHMDVSTVGQLLHNWIKNLAIPPLPSETAVLSALNKGTCDVSIVNHSSFIKEQIKTPDTKVLSFWPNQRSYGVLMDISGAGILKQTPNIKKTTHLLEWLTDLEAQKVLTESTHEYPANPRVSWSESVLKLGTFREDDTPLSKVYDMHAPALRLLKTVGYQ